LYSVETRALNQAVKRNIERFPKDFMFQLTLLEAENLIRESIITDSLRSQIVILNKEKSKNSQNLRSQIVTSKIKRGKNIKYLPYAFTEQGEIRMCPICSGACRRQ
ncbi:MAG: ORF6N domain-containing protein, partial [Patescibacteria group bacterium]